MTGHAARSRLVFAGTPDFAVPALEALAEAGHEILAVYTQPDRPAGRGRQLRPSPVRRAAEARGLAVRTPRTLDDPDTRAELLALSPQLLVVVAYGLILPEAVLEIPEQACLNIHASLLPRWRGAAPIHRAILAGDAETGISIMEMDAGLDTGPVLAQRSVPIGPETTAGDLHDALASLGAETLVEILPDYLAGRLRARPQPAEGVCYARKLDKSEARMDLRRPATELARQVRGLQPWPVADCDSSLGVLRVWGATALAGSGDAPPGTVVAEGPAGLDVATGDGILRITRLQRAGKRPMDVAEFLNAGVSLEGEVLG